MKHFGNCGMADFVAGAMGMRDALNRWIDATGARAIRRRYPERADGDDHAAFLGELIAAAMACPEETRAALCAATFTDPEHFDERPMRDYLEAALEMYADQAVRDFFTLLAAQPGRTSTGP